MSMARSTPAQKPRGLASRISMRYFPTLRRPFRESLIECGLQARMHAAHAAHHALRPVEVLAPALEIPLRGRPLNDIAQVADLVGELHQLRLAAQARRVLDLQALALGL